MVIIPDNNNPSYAIIGVNKAICYKKIKKIMRKLSCWLIIAVLTIHMSVYSMDYTNDVTEFESQESIEILQTDGRGSHQMSGNGTGSSSHNCNFTNSADGLGGPVWDSTASYNLDDIVEWPAGSGHFWQSTTAGPTSEPAPDGKWTGPCSCEEIADATGFLWDSTVAYNPWQIVEYNGAIWFAQDAGTNAGDVPQDGSDLWVLCEDSCASIVNMSTPVWENSTLVTEGEVYEYPAQSGHFYTVVGVGMASQTVGAPGVDLDAWGEPLDCDCKEIWADSGEPVWDSSANYMQNAVVEWPAGSNTLYISFDHGNVEPGSANSSYLWTPCNGDQPSSNLCEEFDGHGGFAWDASMLVSSGEVYEYPPDSGMFYMVSPGIVQENRGAPGVDIDAWSEKGCTCKEIWDAKGQPAWDSSSVYAIGVLLEHPAGSGDIWIAIAPSTTAGVEPGEPWADGNEWELCGPEGNTSGGPCGGQDYVGVWDNLSRVSTGEVYEYPAGSQNYYEVVIQGYLDQEVSSPTIDLDVWAPVDCPCEETWETNGQPVWDASVTYSPNSVVEWPAGSQILYIGDTPGPGDEPGVDPEWVLCHSPNQTSGEPCAGLNVIGVWDSSITVTSGEVYEYPAGSQNYYEVNPGSPFMNVGAPDVDMDVWTHAYCPCEETWVANGQPVWDISVMYWLDEVVEWPAGSETLWIAIDSTSGDEPSLTSDSWKLCEDEDPSGGGPCAGLNIVGVWSSGMNVTSGDVYQYPAGSSNYYIVNPGSPFWSVSAPDIDMDVWSPIDCPCKETWVANGQPVWDVSTTYYQDEVVEWPANSGVLWMAIDNYFVGSEPTLSALDWEHCADSYPPSNPCAGLDVVGVWYPGTSVSSGEIYEYPMGSDTYYQVNQGGPFTNVNAPDVDMDVWSPIDCPCKETWVANGQPVWVAGTAYPGNYVVEWPAASGNLYIPLEPTGVSSGGGEPGIDIHWVLCEGEGPSPGPCDGLNVPVWDNTTTPVVGDIYEYPANSGNYYQIIFTHEDANAGPDWVANPIVDGGADEFWVAYKCPCKETWVANGEPVWDSTITFYTGNYVVEWPAGSGELYLAEAGGITGAGEPGVDGHWIPCAESDPELEATPDKEETEDEDSVPGIGAVATLLGFLAASAFVRRKNDC